MPHPPRDQVLAPSAQRGLILQEVVQPHALHVVQEPTTPTRDLHPRLHAHSVLLVPSTSTQDPLPLQHAHNAQREPTTPTLDPHPLLHAFSVLLDLLLPSRVPRHQVLAHSVLQDDTHPPRGQLPALSALLVPSTSTQEVLPLRRVNNAQRVPTTPTLDPHRLLHALYAQQEPTTPMQDPHPLQHAHYAQQEPTTPIKEALLHRHASVVQVAGIHPREQRAATNVHQAPIPPEVPLCAPNAVRATTAPTTSVLPVPLVKGDTPQALVHRFAMSVPRGHTPHRVHPHAHHAEREPTTPTWEDPTQVPVRHAQQDLFQLLGLAVALPVPQEVHLMEVLSLALLAHLGSTHPQRAQPTVGRVRRDNGRIQEPLVAQRVQRVQPSPTLASR